MMPIWMGDIVRLSAIIEFMVISVNLISLIRDVLHNHRVLKNIIILMVVFLSIMSTYMIYPIPML